MGEYCRRKAEEAALSKWAGCPDFADWKHREKLRPMPVNAALKPPTARELELVEVTLFIVLSFLAANRAELIDIKGKLK